MNIGEEVKEWEVEEAPAIPAQEPIEVEETEEVPTQEPVKEPVEIDQ